jgi:demethylmenaquinone methyltransferase/2-methoxy-6-polyprenyl-1,4-benzoquinol methylase
MSLDSAPHCRESRSMPDANYVRDAFARIADRYVLANHVLSLGCDVLWRKSVAKRVRGLQPQRLIDIASGTGDLALEIQRQNPDCEVTATDFCPQMLEHASKRGVRRTLAADALDLPFDDASFDVATVAFGLRNMADYPAALREMRRVLQPGGHLMILDFSLPKGMLRTPYRWYLHHVLPRIAGWLTGQRDAYEYLGGSIESFPSGKAMKDLLVSCDLVKPSATPLSCGLVSIYQAMRPR